MRLFTFHNEFDDVDVTLNDTVEVEVGPDGLSNGPPYTVCVVFGDTSIGGENTSEVFPTLLEAHAKFLKYVTNEIQAVLEDGSMVPVFPCQLELGIR